MKHLACFAVTVIHERKFECWLANDDKLRWFLPPSMPSRVLKENRSKWSGFSLTFSREVGGLRGLLENVLQLGRKLLNPPHAA
jgi:hypothetical protein